jgi:thioredoxin 1
MVKELTQTDFDDSIATGTVVVDFWAPWCGPCKMMAPVFDELDGEQKSVTFAKVNVDENSELASKFQVMSIPTLIVFKDGKEAKRVTGFHQKNELEAELSSFF